jgi:hypothetical protein
MTCACGNEVMDGVRCRLGATHKPPPVEKHDSPGTDGPTFPWEQRKDEIPWETQDEPIRTPPWKSL